MAARVNPSTVIPTGSSSFDEEWTRKQRRCEKNLQIAKGRTGHSRSLMKGVVAIEDGLHDLGHGHGHEQLRRGHLFTQDAERGA